ncbi:unnamed protein product [Xylocopa violacea]|uniref:Uncharacterized protein n=1 Tax=Xylocopa violacea TaxID=135666 RepID=A0ABP1P9E0_XYLVO
MTPTVGTTVIIDNQDWIWEEKINESRNKISCILDMRLHIKRHVRFAQLQILSQTLYGSLETQPSILILNKTESKHDFWRPPSTVLDASKTRMAHKMDDVSQTSLYIKKLNSEMIVSSNSKLEQNFRVELNERVK